MSMCLSDLLDATLARLMEAGGELCEILADPAAIEAIFIERGDAAILMDCDREKDVAWYLGQVELRVSHSPGLSVTYVEDGQLLAVTVSAAEVSPPVALGPAPQAEPAVVATPEVETGDPARRAA
jgi:hypothetical protein